MQLVIGNKNYSSWSLRPWLVMRVAGIAFTEHRIPLYGPEAKEKILAFSPAGKVPCLIDSEMRDGQMRDGEMRDDGTRVWDSLAICEYLAEKHPGLWPQDPAARALARSISAEMHSGFPHLREHMSMNVRRRHPGKGRTPEVLAEVARIVAIWSDCRARFAGVGPSGGPFLFGRFSIADAMYAPVVLRFRTYEVELPPVCRVYADAVLALPAMEEWIADSVRETESIPQFEKYV